MNISNPSPVISPIAEQLADEFRQRAISGSSNASVSWNESMSIKPLHVSRHARNTFFSLICIAVMLATSVAQAQSRGPIYAPDPQNRPKGERRIEVPNQRGREDGSRSANGTSGNSGTKSLRQETSKRVATVLSGRSRR